MKPLREGQGDLAEKYRQVLTNSANVKLHGVDQVICETAARLRAKYNWLRTPDALQIATAITHRAEIIVTNDEEWRRVSEIVVFVLQDFAKS